MKIFLTITLLYISAVLCELPPPYPRHGFRPSHQFAQYTQKLQNPRVTYGPPNKPSSSQLSLDVKIPSGLTIEQLIRLTEQIQNNQGRIVNKPQRLQVTLPQSSQSSYLPPPRQPQQLYPPPSNAQLRPPPPGVSQPQANYGSPQQNWRPQNQQQQQFNVQTPQIRPQNTPQTSYRVPNGQLASQFENTKPPSTNYGVPDVKNIETLDDIRNGPQNANEILRQNLLDDFRKQHLPYKEPSGFRSYNSPNNEQGQNTPGVSQLYVPANNNAQNNGGGRGNIPQLENPGTGGFNQAGAGFGNEAPNNVGQNYLPPQTTPRGVPVQTTTLKPQPPVTVGNNPKAVTTYDYDYDQPATDSSVNQDEQDAGPNVSISTAVAGGGNFFYLQQPDGRLQKVILEKTKEPNSKPEEYVAHYYFQNIQALPSVAYSPLINLAEYVQK